MIALKKFPFRIRAEACRHRRGGMEEGAWVVRGNTAPTVLFGGSGEFIST